MTTQPSTSFHSYRYCITCKDKRAFLIDYKGSIVCSTCGKPINTDSAWAKLYVVNNTGMRG